MEPDYQIYYLRVEPADSGHCGVARSRSYVMMRHVATTDCLYDPITLFQEISEYIQDRVQTQPSDYMIASDEEIALEAQAVARVRQIQFRPGVNDLSYLLNDREKQVLMVACKKYEERFQENPYENRNLAIFLGDNPSFGTTWSGVSNKIPTFRLNNGKMYFPYFRRWMCSSERLAAFGFPIRPAMAESMGVPCLPIRDWRRANALAGNCMVLPCVGIAQMVALCCIASKEATGSVY